MGGSIGVLSSGHLPGFSHLALTASAGTLSPSLQMLRGGLSVRSRTLHSSSALGRGNCELLSMRTSAG